MAGQADLRKIFTTSSSASGTYLSGLQAGYTISSTAPEYGNNLTISSVDLTVAGTQLFSINVPAGKILNLRSVNLTNLGSSGALNVEVEVDGVVVLQSNNPSYTPNLAVLIGGTSVSVAVTNIVAKSNIKLRVQRPGASTAAATVRYTLEE